MSLQPATIPAATTGDTEPSDITHTFCECDEDRGLCGADLRAAEYVTTAEDLMFCVVCEDLIDAPCDGCGS